MRCAHWLDRRLDFDGTPADLPLLASLVVPGTLAARARHREDGANGYRANSLYDVIAGALGRVQVHAAEHTSQEAPLLTPEDLAQLEHASPHAFRHTFGTLAVEDDMPIVVQEVLGHASTATTSIYVKAKEKRIAEAAEQYYARQRGQNIQLPNKT